jgi:hypothetical protein
LIQFVLHGPANTILVTSRTGQLNQLLNSYMLPGDIYHYGVTLEENVKTYLSKLFGSEEYHSTLLTVADCIHYYEDDFTHHVISHIFEATITQPDVLKKLEGYKIEWVPINTITSNNPIYKNSLFLPMIVEKLSSLQPHETFIVKN